MSLTRIYALLLRYLYLYPRSIPRILDIVFWPIVDLLIWGWLTLYLQQSRAGIPGIVSALLGAMVFWNFIQRSQQAVSIAFLEEVWERNLLNLFVTPVRVGEFLASTVLIGVVRLALIGGVLSIAALAFFRFNIFSFGLLLIPFAINLFVFGWVLGLIATSIILRFGQSAQILAFALTMLIQPFVAVFYPVSVLPVFIRPVSLAIPAAHVFEGMRQVVITGVVPWSELIWATGLNIVWFLVSLWLFLKMFDYVRVQGHLHKLVD